MTWHKVSVPKQKTMDMSISKSSSKLHSSQGASFPRVQCPFSGSGKRSGYVSPDRRQYIPSWYRSYGQMSACIKFPNPTYHIRPKKNPIKDRLISPNSTGN